MIDSLIDRYLDEDDFFLLVQLSNDLRIALQSANEVQLEFTQEIKN